jgi:hypothetical protein
VIPLCTFASKSTDAAANSLPAAGGESEFQMSELPLWLRVRRRILYLKIVFRYREAKLRLLEVLLWALKPLELLGRALGVEDGIRLKPSQRAFLIEAAPGT